MTGMARGFAPNTAFKRAWASRVVHLATLFWGYFAIALAFHATGGGLGRYLLGGGDGFTAGLPSKIFAATLSPWNPFVQLGQYAHANTQFQPFYPPGLAILGLLSKHVRLQPLYSGALRNGWTVLLLILPKHSINALRVFRGRIVFHV